MNSASAAAANAGSCSNNSPALPPAATLTKLDREIWSIPRTKTTANGTRDNLAAGRLDLHRDGYGFVRPNARQASR